jgi:hypothetical protein
MNRKLRQLILGADLLWIVMPVGFVQLLRNGLTLDLGTVPDLVESSGSRRTARYATRTC